MKFKLFFLILQICASATFVNCWFESCNYQNSVSPSQTFYVISPDFPSYYQPGTSCKWYLTAPVGYTIDLQCAYDLDMTDYYCESQMFYLSIEGDKDLNNAEFFCGYGNFSRKSIGNEISLGYTSNYDGDGWVRCEARAVLTTQQNCQCGWSKSARIIGGSVAQPNEFISMAGLIDITKQNAADGPIFCGGGIISENFVLTASHCFNNQPDISVIYVLVGDHDISKGSDTPYPAIYSTQKVIRHPNYVPTADDRNYDIALVKTFDAIRWKRTIGPVCLPFIYSGFDSYFDGYNLIVLGWGTTEFAGPTSKVLKKTSVAVIDSNECNKTYGDINSGKICTYAKGTDSCQRDSGGNLYWTYGGRQYTIGIVSYGTDCASSKPSVNTRVTSYLPWIEQQLADAFICKRY